MTDQLIANDLHIWQENISWMAWNLFLAWVPLGMSIWLFNRPRSLFLRLGVGILLGATFVYGVQRYDLADVVNFAQNLQTNYLDDLNKIYLVAAFALTIGLMALDIWLLGGRGSRSLIWWVGFLIFIVFLPNAPYVLTDIIHLIDAVSRHWINSVWMITLAFIPQFLVFMLLGFEAYVLSVIYLGDYLRRHGWGKFITWIELIIHGLSAIGIYLGRFQRFNSWHIISQPDQLFNTLTSDLMSKLPVLVISVTFVVITVLYWLMKQVSLGIMLKRRIEEAYSDSGLDRSTADS